MFNLILIESLYSVSLSLVYLDNFLALCSGSVSLGFKVSTVQLSWSLRLYMGRAGLGDSSPWAGLQQCIWFWGVKKLLHVFSRESRRLGGRNFDIAEFAAVTSPSLWHEFTAVMLRAGLCAPGFQPGCSRKTQTLAMDP